MFSVFDKVQGNVCSPAKHVFTRAGAYFGLEAKLQRHTRAQDLGKWGSSDLYVTTGRGGASARGSRNCLLLVPVHHGVMVPYAMETSPTELKLRTAYGDICLCFAEKSLLLIKGENGLGLLVENDNRPHQFLRRRKENSWEIPNSPTCSLVVTETKGSFRMDGKYDFQRLSHPQVRGEVIPAEDGAFLLAIEEFSHLGYTRDSYPDYETGLASVTADWEDYLAQMPELPGYEAARIPAAYLTWSLLGGSAHQIENVMLFSAFGQASNGFQLCQAAAALSGNLPLAIELLLAQLQHQSPDGQLPAFHDDTRVLAQTVSVPAQGWALEQLMQTHDLAKEVPAEKLAALYEGLAKWVGWYDACRDHDGDGVPQYESAEECGFDGCPVFEKQNAVELPDLCAFLALLEEKLGDLAGMLGRAERADWYARSKARIERMISAFWNGKRFVGRVAESGAKIEDESIVFYRPLILGKRLPEEIVAAMAADIAEGGYLAPGGVSSRPTARIEGSELPVDIADIAPAENLLVATGLLAAGKTELAETVAKRYCDGAVRSGAPASFFVGSADAAVFQILAQIAK